MAADAPTSRPETPEARTGRLGEEAAAAWLERAGFTIVARNWRAGRYELDIVAVRGDELHFVEVKTRRPQALTAPEEALTLPKRRALRRAASAFLAAAGRRFAGCDPRFDLAAVHGSEAGGMEVEWIPDAILFGW